MTHHLVSWGANSHGQLGQGIRSEECAEPREVHLSKCGLDPWRIKRITGGAGHTLILDDRARVYSCGWNNKGQAGFPREEDALLFEEIDALREENVVDVACGWDTSAALTRDGRVYLWGSNSYGQLGIEPRVLRCANEPFEARIGRKIRRVAMGLRHTALVTEDGKVLVSGSNSKGQLGLGDPKNMSTFTEISAITDVEDVACGQHHTIVVARNNDLYGIGDNKHGQLGLNSSTVARAMLPIKLPSPTFESMVKPYTGWSHTVLLHDNSIFCCGRNSYGQLGAAEAQRPTSWKIERIPSIGNIRQFAAGSEHNVALTEEGTILCWGWNEHGNCGNGSTRDVFTPGSPSLAFLYSATIVGAGAGHSLAVIKKL